MSNHVNDTVARWLTALEERHLANLRVAEVTRALRALSSAYVERRHRLGQSTLDSAGKRAAFAMFYSPLHMLTATNVIEALHASAASPRTILDLGCGTGVAGAAWALAAGGRPAVRGLDRHPWAVDEARWTYRQLGISGRARKADVARLARIGREDAIIAGWFLNELEDDQRTRIAEHLFEAAQEGARVLVLEPIARSLVPWWDATAARVIGAGGRADEWRFPVELPPMLRLLDKAAGLNHQELTVRSLYLDVNRGGR